MSYSLEDVAERSSDHVGRCALSAAPYENNANMRRMTRLGNPKKGYGSYPYAARNINTPTITDAAYVNQRRLLCHGSAARYRMWTMGDDSVYLPAVILPSGSAGLTYLSGATPINNLLTFRPLISGETCNVYVIWYDTAQSWNYVNPWESDAIQTRARYFIKRLLFNGDGNYRLGATIVEASRGNKWWEGDEESMINCHPRCRRIVLYRDCQFSGDYIDNGSVVAVLRPGPSGNPPTNNPFPIGHPGYKTPPSGAPQLSQDLTIEPFNYYSNFVWWLFPANTSIAYMPSVPGMGGWSDWAYADDNDDIFLDGFAFANAINNDAMSDHFSGQRCRQIIGKDNYFDSPRVFDDLAAYISGFDRSHFDAIVKGQSFRWRKVVASIGTKDINPIDDGPYAPFGGQKQYIHYWSETQTGKLTTIGKTWIVA